MSAHIEYIQDQELRPLQLSNANFNALGLAIGGGNQGLEVVYTSSPNTPSKPNLRSAWKDRKAGRAAPLLFVTFYNDKAAICGPSGDDAPAYINLDPGQVVRICKEALQQPDRHAAQRSLRDSLPKIHSELPGLTNNGLLATHELKKGVPERVDWQEANQKALRIVGSRGESLLKGLGFSIERNDAVTSILTSDDHKSAIAVLLKDYESPEIQIERFSNLTPISYALNVADHENLDYVIVLHGEKIRIYPTQVGKGVGQRGRTDTFLECHIGLLKDTDAAYLWLIFSNEALSRDGTLEQILNDSYRFSGELAKGLRDRIYNDVIPILSTGIVNARHLKSPTAQDLSETYEMAMIVLYRLLFIAYAEDKDLLPYQWNGLYQRRSLKTKSTEILEVVNNEQEFDDGDNLWDEITRLFIAVDKGNKEWGVPAYNGGLFSIDTEVSKVGSLLSKITLSNTIIGPVLQNLLLVETPEGYGPVDFRSLGVREFGTIYEGLLESELSLAENNLTIDKHGYYKPCSGDDDVAVEKGDVYIHNSSGARKASGSYYTKHFAVEHLLEKSLEPALKEHFARLDSLDEHDAGEAFFDFRIADIAMGSGHFLIAAIDRIEKAFNSYLATRALPLVQKELAQLQNIASETLGDLANQIPIEDAQLLRRLIARRCVYGVDINPIAVQLARLAVWIHTFVPGLALSFLDHNFKCGNSLVGIGTLNEIEDKIKEENEKSKHGGMASLFAIDSNALLSDAVEPLKRLALINDATSSDVKKAQQAQAEILSKIAPAKALCDIITHIRITGDPLPAEIDFNKWEQEKDRLAVSMESQAAANYLSDLNPIHFPIAFPEVFLRDRSGFDVIVGNPPWEKAKIEEHAFWARYLPGLRALTQRERASKIVEIKNDRIDLTEILNKEIEINKNLRKSLISGPYPGMGTGDPDLYKAFCWRFWNLICNSGGRIGVVLPRSALNAKGSTEFRFEIFKNSKFSDITTVTNTRGWVFDEAEHRYTIAFVSLHKITSDNCELLLRGPYNSYENYISLLRTPGNSFLTDEVFKWNDTASLPLLPSDGSVNIFLQLRKSSNLDYQNINSWRSRPIVELHATQNADLLDLNSENCPNGYWPVYTGTSFNLWNNDTGSYYAWVNSETIVSYLNEKRKRSFRSANSAFSEFSNDWIDNIESIPCLNPRIAFRDITNRTNKRTVIVALIPPEVVLVHKAPYLLWPKGNEMDQAYLLGIMSSIPFDWYARRFVETQMTYYILNSLPVPRINNDNLLAKRIVQLSGRLACPDERFADWASKVGVSCGPLDEDEKEDMIHELDAIVAHAYGLSEEHLIHIFETFHIGWDYEERLQATLTHYRQWSNKL